MFELGLTISVAQATVTQTVSHVPVKPKYGFSEPNPNMAPDSCDMICCLLNCCEVEICTSSKGQSRLFQYSTVSLTVLECYDERRHGSFGAIGRIPRS